MHGCGWDSGAARERSSALPLAASVASRYTRSAPMAWALRVSARPGARGSRVTASRYALGAEGGGAARPGASCADATRRLDLAMLQSGIVPYFFLLRPPGWRRARARAPRHDACGDDDTIDDRGRIHRRPCG